MISAFARDFLARASFSGKKVAAKFLGKNRLNIDVPFRSGCGPIDHYLRGRYNYIPGMSSPFAAAICGRIIQSQSENGISGNMLELGVFEGRFFIALALGLQPEEKAFAIDVFSWPDAGVLERFLQNCRGEGLQEEALRVWQVDSSGVSEGGLKLRMAEGPARFVHVDADHTPKALSHDLELAHSILHPRGVICIDDVNHPSYPLLMPAVLHYLEAHRDMRVVCVIDRQDIIAAGKILVCHADDTTLYSQILDESFSGYRFGLDALFEGYNSVVLSPEPITITDWRR